MRVGSLVLIAIVLAAACGDGDLAEVEAERDAAEQRVTELESEVADLETQIQELESELSELRAEKEDDTPQISISRLVQEHQLANLAVDIGDTYVSLQMFGSLDDLEGLLDELEFPAATRSRIANTRALDGTLTAESDIATASWTYHPDDGLRIVVELKEP